MEHSKNSILCPHCGETVYGEDYVDGPGDYYHNSECEWCDKPITVNISYHVDISVDKGHKDN